MSRQPTGHVLMHIAIMIKRSFAKLLDPTSTTPQFFISRYHLLGNTLRLWRSPSRTTLIFSVLFLLMAIIVSARGNFTLDPGIVDAAERKYGPVARRNLLAWQQFIREDNSATDLPKLERVNTFFNEIEFISDSIHWSQKDYWATPVEFIASGGGDCEDFALAKYFTLKLVGVAEEKLHLTYVKAISLNQSHMVLTYYEKPGAIPLILDNLKNTIVPATERPDLLPVYTFNGTGLWLAKERGKGNLVGKSDRLKLWNDLLDRMPANLK